MTETGTKSSTLIRCGNCAAILDVNVTLSSDTPGAELQAVVVATRPCRCGRRARTLVRIGGNSD